LGRLSIKGVHNYFGYCFIDREAASFPSCAGLHVETISVDGRKSRSSKFLTPPLSTGGIIAVVIASAAIVILFTIIGTGFLWGAGYEPVDRKSLKKMLEIAEPLEGRQVYDLGSGYGRIVVEAGRHGAAVTGFEMDPLKVWWSRRAIQRKGLAGRATIVRENLLAADLSRADVVFVFLWPGIMEKLKAKVLQEMKPGSLVVSYYHMFKNWKADFQDDKLEVYAYRIPARTPA